MTSRAFFTYLYLLLLSTPTFAAQIGYWPGEGTASDLSGNGNDGNLLNGATFGTGVVGQGFILDGSDDIVQVLGNVVLQPTEITVAAWVKVDSVPDGQFAHVVERAEGAQGFNLNLSTSIARFVVTTDTSGTPITAEGTTNIVEENEFHHLAGTFDGSHVRIYVNGNLEGSTPVSGVIEYTGTLDLIFGGNQLPASTRFFDGIIDEVMLFDEALSEDEIRNLAPEASGDFDADGDVDGMDFLKWQRGESPNPYSDTDLARWEEQYGNAWPAPLAAQATVPEPTSLALILVGLSAVPRRRR